jgi:hypothetical protein
MEEYGTHQNLACFTSVKACQPGYCTLVILFLSWEDTSLFNKQQVQVFRHELFPRFLFIS